MPIEVLRVAAAKTHPLARLLPVTMERARRYAEIQERLFSPEGTFPVMGLSEAYCLGRLLPPLLYGLAQGPAARGQAGRGARGHHHGGAPHGGNARDLRRAGLTQARRPGLPAGSAGNLHATGSLYICLMGLVHLGLPADDPLWADPPAPWTQQLIWSGADVQHDRSLEGWQEK
jgi:hypothetical protein